jgi:hypothetical protein
MYYIVFMLAIYSYGGVINLNGALDRSSTQVFQSRVIDKYLVRGSRGRVAHHLVLVPWGRWHNNQDVDVRPEIYGKYEIGSASIVEEREGLFGIPYFDVK